jgi:hypothetical protein
MSETETVTLRCGPEGVKQRRFATACDGHTPPCPLSAESHYRFGSRACGNDLRLPDSRRFTVGDRNDAAEAVDVVSCGF